MLKKENESLWLDSNTSPETLDEILNPIPAQEITYYPVSPVVNSWKIDNLKCIQPE